MKTISRSKIIKEGFSSGLPQAVVDKVMTDYLTREIGGKYNPEMLIKQYHHQTMFKILSAFKK